MFFFLSREMFGSHLGEETGCLSSRFPPFLLPSLSFHFPVLSLPFRLLDRHIHVCFFVFVYLVAELCELS